VKCTKAKRSPGKLALWLTNVFWLASTGFAQEVGPDYRHLPQQVYHPGEYLEYRVHFGKMNAGRGALHIRETAPVNGREMLQLVSRLWTNDFFSSFYQVDDVMESYFDRAGLFPWRYERRIREGKFKALRRAIFDPMNNRAFEGKDTLAVPAYSQDVLSIIYYVRTLELQAGQTIDLDSYVDKKVYPLRLTVEKPERVKVPAGQFDCLVLVPGKRPGSTMEPKGEMWIWLSTDQRRLPVRIKSRASLGSVTMDLDKIKFIE
jgi:hypothetical protein